MFEENVDKQFLINCSKAKDSYILYKGKMVSSNLINVEVIFNRKQEMRRKMMVDTNDDMRRLSSKIIEVCDCFPKLSGLNSLTAVNLKKKTDSGFINLKESGLIGESIKSNDVIYFDLSLYEIWLDIEMILESKNLVYKIKFELKVSLHTIKSDFEDVLINLGIKSWASIAPNSYYALTELMVDYPSKISSQIYKSNTSDVFGLNGSSSELFVSFDFDSKLSCRIIFTDLFQIVLDSLYSSYRVKEMTKRSLSDSNRDQALQCYFNEVFSSWLMKCDYIAMFNNIIWRYQPQVDHLNIDVEETDMDSSSFDRSFNSNKERSHMCHLDKKGLSSFTTFISSFKETEFRMKSFQKLGSNTQLNQLYKKEYHFLKFCIDYSSIVNQYGLLYIPQKEFESKSPDTKNLEELSNGMVESFEVEMWQTQAVYSKDEVWMESKRKWLKSRVWIIFCLIVVVLLCYVLFN